VGTVLGVGAVLSFLAFFSGFTTEVSPLTIVALLVALVINTIVEGFYPILTKRVLDGEDVDLGGAASHALGRFYSLLGASIVIALLTFATFGIGYVLSLAAVDMDFFGLAFIGLIIMVIGLVLALYVMCWYYCAIPVLMLEDRGVLDALSTSKVFSQGKKKAIFGLIIVVSLLSMLVSIMIDIFPSSVRGVLMILVGLFFAVYNSVLSSYLYIRYGGLRVAPPPPAPVIPAPVSPMP